MKSIRSIQRIGAIILLGAYLQACQGAVPNQESSENEVELTTENSTTPSTAFSTDATTIKIALLLDTSGSMSGLLEQAKSQLWKIVNQLSLAKKGDQYASLLISLYEYGNDGLEQSEGYVRQIIGLTTDLDEISKELFALTTNGGEEYCGEVIRKSLTQLDWQSETEGLQVIFIAGNEPFDQGKTDYHASCADALASDIIVNTIYCGNQQEGINGHWKNGADLTEGFFGTIEMNDATIYIETPFDDQIQAYNSKLNATYLAYGAQKDYKLQNQTMQDANASDYGRQNEVERTISKTKSVYTNETWDLVDANKKGGVDWATIKADELPDEMKNMSEAEKDAYIAKKTNDRAKIQQTIADLNIKRLAYIEKQEVEMGIENNGLDHILLEAIKKQAIAKNFTFEDEQTQ